MLVATMVAKRPRAIVDAPRVRDRPWNTMAVRGDWTLTEPHAGVADHPSPLFPAGLLRSEPAAGRFKAAIAPRSGRNPADLGKAGPRPAQGQ